VIKAGEILTDNLPGYIVIQFPLGSLNNQYLHSLHHLPRLINLLAQFLHLVIICHQHNTSFRDFHRHTRSGSVWLCKIKTRSGSGATCGLRQPIPVTRAHTRDQRSGHGLWERLMMVVTKRDVTKTTC